MDVDCKSGNENDDDGDVRAELPPANAQATANGANNASAEADVTGGSSGGDPTAKTCEALDELRVFIQGEFFGDLRRRVLHYIDEIQAQQQRELPGALGEELVQHVNTDVGEDDSSDSNGEDHHVTPGRLHDRKVDKLRRHLEQKWNFPDIPGRRAAPGSVEMEFMRTLIQILQLEDCLADHVVSLRDRMCQKLRMSSFGAACAVFENPCFPVILRDVVCPWCCAASHVDVTSHPSRGPGLWVCPHCERLFDKDAVQALLVGMLENVVQAWQAQEITCQKCRRFRTSHLQTTCECFGRFEVRFSSADFRTVLVVLRSLVMPHDLPWLGEMVTIYDRMV